MLHYCAPPLNLEGLIGFTFQLLAGSFVVVIHTVENSITSLKLERCHMVIYGTARALQVLYANKQTSPKTKIPKSSETQAITFSLLHMTRICCCCRNEVTIRMP